MDNLNNTKNANFNGAFFEGGSYIKIEILYRSFNNLANGYRRGYYAYW